MITEVRGDIYKVAQEVLTIEADAVNNLKNTLDNNFKEAIKIILKCEGKVIVTGMGKSGLIGRKIASTLTSTGTPSVFLHPAESTHGDSGLIGKSDIIIAISNSGETSELLNLIPIIKRLNVPIIALTAKKESTLGKLSDIVLDISVKKEACPLNKAPTASTTATLALGDAIAICLLKQRGFTENDFLLFHPSGSLGRGSLYKVSDLMIKSESLPIIRENESFLNCVKYISEKKIGCTIVVDNLGKTSGIVTDGDIRRTLINKCDIKELKVCDIMTKSPKMLMGNELAQKALALMEKYAITSLIINSKDNKPIGLIHIHDLLKSQVA